MATMMLCAICMPSQSCKRGLLQELVHEFREDNKQALLNVISDSITGILLFVILASNHEGREVLFRTVGRVFGGLSDTAKAFLIIASTDILLGWAAGTECSAEADHTESQGMPVPQSSQLGQLPLLCRYHSEEGWTAAIKLLLGHYGSEVEVSICCTLQ